MKKILVALTLVSGLFLTGCSQSNEAATVGDFKITQTELQGSIDAVIAERATVDTTQMQLLTRSRICGRRTTNAIPIANSTPADKVNFQIDRPTALIAGVMSEPLAK